MSKAKNPKTHPTFFGDQYSYLLIIDLNLDPLVVRKSLSLYSIDPILYLE
jgi:hypothetical protein